MTKFTYNKEKDAAYLEIAQFVDDVLARKIVVTKKEFGAKIQKMIDQIHEKFGKVTNDEHRKWAQKYIAGEIDEEAFD